MRRLITAYKKQGVMCKDCKYALPVDARHNKYYCVHPEKKPQICYGGRICGKGEQK